jgi:hypothetical protein
MADLAQLERKLHSYQVILWYDTRSDVNWNVNNSTDPLTHRLTQPTSTSG